jgi:hypothetical protein
MCLLPELLDESYDAEGSMVQEPSTPRSTPLMPHWVAEMHGRRKKQANPTWRSIRGSRENVAAHLEKNCVAAETLIESSLNCNGLYQILWADGCDLLTNFGKLAETRVLTKVIWILLWDSDQRRNRNFRRAALQGRGSSRAWIFKGQPPLFWDRFSGISQVIRRRNRNIAGY